MIVEVSIVFYLIDLFGTFAFAVSGAFKAIKNDLDVIGVLFLATITGVGGGVIRDVLLNRIPPFLFTNPMYVIVTMLTGFGVFFLHRYVDKQWKWFLRFDAIGVGAFSMIGASVAYLTGLGFVGIATAGVLTAVGGGIIRDSLVREIPLVFSRELYASVSFVGILIFYFLILSDLPLGIAMLIGMFATIFLRILSIEKNLNLPRAKK